MARSYEEGVLVAEASGLYYGRQIGRVTDEEYAKLPGIDARIKELEKTIEGLLKQVKSDSKVYKEFCARQAAICLNLRPEGGEGDIFLEKQIAGWTKCANGEIPGEGESWLFRLVYMRIKKKDDG